MSVLDYTKSDIECIKSIALLEIENWLKNIVIFENLILVSNNRLIECKERAAAIQKEGNKKAYEFLMKDIIPSLEEKIQTYRQLAIDYEFLVKKHEELIKSYDALLEPGKLPNSYSEN
jgi:hypothetical protein